MTPARAHGAAAVFFALLTIALTWPLAAHLSTAIPGAGPGDNLYFLWDVWWFRHRRGLPGAAVAAFHQ